MESNEPSVRFKNIIKSYPGAASPSLDVEDLSINRGEFFSILGPSGSGKTTALRLIAGFERPDEGSVIIDGQDVTNVPPHRRHVNTVFQSYALFPHMTVQDNVEYPLRMAGLSGTERRRRALEALDLVAMASFADRLPHQMSGGQRQRVALARAFVGRPKVLLLDEPLSALDLGLRQQMQHVLVDLQRNLGLTFVYVTHDQGEALSMSDNVAVIAAGKVQQLDRPTQIYYEPSNRFVAQFIGKSNLIPVNVRTNGDGSTVRLNGLDFHITRQLRSGNSQLAVRFEALALSPAETETSHPVQLEGRISDMLFLGNALQIKVVCGEMELISLVPSRRDSPFCRDQIVRVSFDPRECSVFND
ncbi:ABC transporter ATP-binding protein [Pararhizobium sp.]|uniref:ABC transporter ATP-binding protein n=1 Tax=Pararhizobium sp. TaxID=1977563 RepID=UPI00271802F4|nr:ABC transporter ATP-binding protein [Pararhizobium sp.]MDO9415547.1 ABC transporter ATP-binding protein [Pararhizobium sp.]